MKQCDATNTTFSFYTLEFEYFYIQALKIFRVVHKNQQEEHAMIQIKPLLQCENMKISSK